MNPVRRTQILYTSLLGAFLAHTPGADAQGVSSPPLDDRVGGVVSRPQVEASAQDIIVTARRVNERLQDVPISITVFNQQQLLNRNVVSAADLATYTPSLSSSGLFGSANTTFAIRGFVQDIGTQPSVGVYFADVVAPRGAANNVQVGDGAGPGTLFDLQNVQVLKGPQGTLFGRNTTGGAVLLVPQKPTERLEGYVEGSYGNYDMKRVQAVINVPLSDVARLRLGVDHQSRDGYLRNDTGVGPERFDGINYTAVRASLVVDLQPDLENYTIASFVDSNTTGDIMKIFDANSTGLGFLGQAQLANEAAKGAGFYTVQNSLSNPEAHLRQWQIINTTTWQASDNLTIKNIASYAQLSEDLRSAIFGTDFNLSRISSAAFGAGQTIVFAPTESIPGRHLADQSTFTEEFRLQGQALGNALAWQAGAYYEDSEPLGLVGSQSPVLLNCQDVANFLCANPLGSGGVSYSATRTRFRDVGLYAQSTYSILDNLKITGGFRYTWDRSTNYSTLKTFYYAASLAQSLPISQGCTNPDLTAPGCNVVFRQRSSAPTWLIDLDYKPFDSLLLYGKYSRGYRAGGIAPSAPTTLAVYNPEHVDTYEAGAKFTFQSRIRGIFNVAAFYNDFSDQQLQVNLNPKPGVAVAPLSAIQNAGKSRIWGVEVESSITPVAGLTLDVSYSYINAKIVRVTPIALPEPTPFVVTSQFQSRDPLALTPRNKVSATATYVLPFNKSFGEISIASTLVYRSSEVSNYVLRDASGQVSGNSKLPSLTLVNLNLNWTSVAQTNFDLSFFVTNLTARKYFTLVPGLIGTIGVDGAAVGQPRMFGGRLRYHF